MKYYIMSEDKRIQNRFVIKEFPTSQAIDLDSSHAEEIKDHTALFTLEKEDCVYPEMLEAPMVMLEKKVYEVIRMYDSEVVCKNVSIINQKKKSRYSYYITLLDRKDCLHKESEFYKDHSVKCLVLDRNKIRGSHIFKVQGISANTVIVSMDVAESILRRGCYGIRFTEVECR